MMLSGSPIGPDQRAETSCNVRSSHHRQPRQERQEAVIHRAGDPDDRPASCHREGRRHEGEPIPDCLADRIPRRADDYKTFETLPIGWDNVGNDWFKRVVGWLITTAAISLGAPFWFDLLGKVANLRGSGASARPAKAP